MEFKGIRCRVFVRCTSWLHGEDHTEPLHMKGFPRVLFAGAPFVSSMDASYTPLLFFFFFFKRMSFSLEGGFSLESCTTADVFFGYEPVFVVVCFPARFLPGGMSSKVILISIAGEMWARGIFVTIVLSLRLLGGSGSAWVISFKALLKTWFT